VSLIVHPVTPVIGAEVSGMDLRQPLTEATVTELQQALHRWKVLFFRGQELSDVQFVRFGRYFGHLMPAHPFVDGSVDHPEIFKRSADDYRNRRQTRTVPTEAPTRDSKGWHIDMTFIANPSKYCMLYGVEIPPLGGDTLWTNLVTAYEGLSPAIRTLVDGLQAVHVAAASEYIGGKARDAARYASLHPLVQVHPETGEKILFLNPAVITRIAGLNTSESNAILDLLFQEITRLAYHVRFQWTQNAIALWDNRATAHAGPVGYWQFDQPRVVHRISVAGSLPEGPDGFRSRPLEGDLVKPIEPRL
jgi:alpha-ketoglutarate-dependent sulfate ester dioxygenase